MTPAEFFLMAGYLNVEAEDRKAALARAREEAEDESDRKSGKQRIRIRGPGLKGKR